MYIVVIPYIIPDNNWALPEFLAYASPAGTIQEARNTSYEVCAALTRRLGARCNTPRIYGGPSRGNHMPMEASVWQDYVLRDRNRSRDDDPDRLPEED